MAQQIKFSGEMKRAAETQPSKYALIMRQGTTPHVGKKQLAKSAQRGKA